MRSRYTKENKAKKWHTRDLTFVAFLVISSCAIFRMMSAMLLTFPTNAVVAVSNEFNEHGDVNPTSIVEEKKWGETYEPSRIWCLVPTLYPRNTDNMKAVASTWGKWCTKLVFVLDDKLKLPKSLTDELNSHRGNVEFLYLSGIAFIQSSTERNIWSKVWRMWHYIYLHHLHESEWFLKIDDDSFFSAVSFHGFAQYFNPDNSSYYIGHTLLHEWERRNIIFNAGACYALSRGVLRKLGAEILSLATFQNDEQRDHDEYHPLPEGVTDESKQRLKWEWRNYCVGDRKYAQEDPSMGICLRSIGINPINTLDREFRQRFHIFRPNDMAAIDWEDTWFWRYKDKRIGGGANCCSTDSISFHSFKVDHKGTLQMLQTLDEQYNVENLNRKYEKPFDSPPTLFLYDAASAPQHDAYFNFVRPPPGQRLYKGPNQTRICNKCEWFDIKDLV